MGISSLKGMTFLDREIARMWSRAWPTVIGLIVMTAVLLFLYRAFVALTPPVILGVWMAFMIGNVLFVGGAIAAFAVPRLRMTRPLGFWRGIARVTTVSFCTGISASVWILMPVADSDLRLMMMFLYMWFIAMILMADGSMFSALAAMSLIVSLVAFVLTDGMPYAWPMAGFLVMAGVAILGIRRFIWRAADDAAEARAAAERAAEALNDALALVTGERDAKTRFLASASHDLQQPLQAASLYFDQAIADADTPTRQRAIAGVRSALGSTQALIASMLDYLRLEAGAMPARIEPLALDALFAAVQLEHGAAARAAGMRLIAVRSTLAVRADAQLLRRVLGNLVANAVRHARGERILIGARARGGRVQLWVVDDGNGIAERDVAQLFDDYAQGSDHGAENRGGFGLGLASARRMVTLMNGAIDLDRRWTGGSAFRIDLAAEPARIADIMEPRCNAA